MNANAAGIRPLVLPAIPASGAVLLNALLSLELPDAFRVGTTRAAVHVATAAPRLKGIFRISLSANGSPWQVTLDGLSLLRAHPLFAEPEAAGVDPAGLPPELLSALAETLLAPLLASLSEAIGIRILFEDARCLDESVEAPAGFLVNLELPEGSRAITVALEPAGPGAAEELAAALRCLPRRRDAQEAERLDGLPFRCVLSGGSMTLGREAFAALDAGDILLPETWLPAAGAACLMLRTAGTTFAAACTYENGRATLTQELIPIEEKNMQDTDAMEVKLTFELEERTLTLAELKAIGTGYVFTLTADRQAPVTVTANGRPVAKGRLVDVNGAVGVQVTELR